MTPALTLALTLLQAVPVAADSGEGHLKNIHQLTFGGQNAEAYFSASGKQLIFQREDSVPGGICDQEYVMNVDGTGVRRVSTGVGRTTCGWFYARDTRIFYASTDRASALCPPRPDYSHGYVWALYDYDIFAADSDGTHRVQLTDNRGYDAEGTLSPNGRTIVFTSERRGDLDIYTMKTDGSRLRRLTRTLGYDGGPAYSPDGKLIVYRAFHPQTAADSTEYRGLLAQHLVQPTRMDLWVMNADGTNQHQITRLAGASFAPAFTPDGRRLIFASNTLQPTTDNFDLYLVNLDGSGLERVTTSPGFNAFPMFSPDGKLLVWESSRGAKVRHETNIFVADWVERP
jgi:TolB protein